MGGRIVVTRNLNREQVDPELLCWRFKESPKEDKSELPRRRWTCVFSCVREIGKIVEGSGQSPSVSGG